MKHPLTDSLKNLFMEIETQIPCLKKTSGLHSFESAFEEKNPSNQEIRSYLNEVRFTIDPLTFRELKFNFSQNYVDINFVYSVNAGVRYRIDPFIVETLEISDKTRMLEAVSTYLPDKKEDLDKNWGDMSINQKTDLLYLLETQVMKKVNLWQQEEASQYFVSFEEDVRDTINSIFEKRGWVI